MSAISFLDIEHFNFGVAMMLNILALFLIFTKSRKEICQYRKLLVIFLICGICFAILHLIIQPRVIIRENMFVLYGAGWITGMEILCIYCGIASMSFLILAMHFVYRAMAILRKTFTNVEISHKMVIKIILILSIDLIVWTIVCVKFLCYKDVYASTISRLTADLDDFPKSDHERRLMMFLGTVNNKLNLSPFLAILSMIGICSVSLTLIVWSSVRIISVLNDKEHRSSSWRKYNHQLFVALYLQFLGPLILLYIPCIAYLLLPFVPGHGFSSPPWLLSLCYSIYPIVDPLVMIIFIRDYRRGLYNLLKKAVCLAPIEENIFHLSSNSRPH